MVWYNTLVSKSVELIGNARVLFSDFIKNYLATQIYFVRRRTSSTRRNLRSQHSQLSQFKL
uniref:Uncharacterized protein n=1 Tax=Glossina pallidipes TaxID=7398 RepID=A0A1A9ZJT9_GLOPL